MNAIENLVELGKRLKKSPLLEEKIIIAQHKNPWFVPQFVHYALDALITEMLDERNLRLWLDKYELKQVDKTVALVFAGNVPLVGFHDFLCCYVAGCRMKIKLSSKDDELFPFILDELKAIDSSVCERVEIMPILKGFDAVIATGSDNTNRYFESYFRNYPRILRKNRNSVAILTGDESDEDLQKLADDVFLYFGFGCRNVSKLYLPFGYDFVRLFPQFSRYQWLFQHGKYMNNYDYNRTLLLMNKVAHFSNDFVMLTENTGIPSPISTVHYEFWHDENVLTTRLKQDAAKIQCVVSAQPDKWPLASSVKFGESQHPQLWDYADGADTLQFLLGL